MKWSRYICKKYFKTTSFDNVVFNLYDFWNIAVSQGNAVTSVMYGGLYNTNFVENFVLSPSVKESWKSINIFREVIDASRVSCFFDSQCTVCCLVVWLGLGLDLVAGWLVAMYTYLYYTTFRCRCPCPFVVSANHL